MGGDNSYTPQTQDSHAHRDELKPKPKVTLWFHERLIGENSATASGIPIGLAEVGHFSRQDTLPFGYGRVSNAPGGSGPQLGEGVHDESLGSREHHVKLE